MNLLPEAQLNRNFLPLFDHYEHLNTVNSRSAARKSVVTQQQRQYHRVLERNPNGKRTQFNLTVWHRSGMCQLFSI